MTTRSSPFKTRLWKLAMRDPETRRKSREQIRSWIRPSNRKSRASGVGQVSATGGSGQASAKGGDEQSLKWVIVHLCVLCFRRSFPFPMKISWKQIQNTNKQDILDARRVSSLWRCHNNEIDKLAALKIPLTQKH